MPTLPRKSVNGSTSRYVDYLEWDEDSFGVSQWDNFSENYRKFHYIFAITKKIRNFAPQTEEMLLESSPLTY